MNSKRLAPIRATDLRGKKDLSALGATAKSPLINKFDEGHRDLIDFDDLTG